MARSTVAVRFTGDVADLKRGLGDVESKVGGLGSKIGSFAKTAALGLGAAGVGAVALGKNFYDAAIESQKVTKQTEAVLKSMGLAAGVSAENIGDLAGSMAMASGVDDELIQSGMNVLLTFGNVASSAQEVGGIFDQASQAALDMSVALGTDMTSASMMVGKALNDPIDGLSKLARSGIQFTDEQKEQIKTMQEAGDMAGAQAIMLGELNRQFGGSAAAQATAGDKLKVVWGNLQEQLGAKLIPVVEKVATFLANNLPAAMDVAGQAFARIQAVVEQWWPRIVAGFQQIVAFVRDNWPQIQSVITAVVDTVRGNIEGFITVVTVLWDNFGNNILSFVQRVWPAIQQVIEAALTIIRSVVQTITALIQGDWSGVWEGIKGIVWGAWNAIQGIVRTALEVIRGILGIGLEIIGSLFRGAWNGIADFFAGLPSRLGAAASAMWEAMKNGLAAAVSWILGQIDRLLGPLDEILGKLAKVKGFLVGDIDWKAKIEGARAGGGPITAGSWLVGERGPEIVTVGSSGFVTPNHALTAAAASDGVIEVHTHLYLDGKHIAESVRRHERGLR